MKAFDKGVSAIILITLLIVYVASTGCSVGMAMSGSKDPNLSLLRVGATRGEVELTIGSPIKTASTADGGRVDLYEYETGNEPSTGRAVMHGAFDVLTLGLWEVIGTPIEGYQGDKQSMSVSYDANDRVLAINSVTPIKTTETASPNNTFE